MSNDDYLSSLDIEHIRAACLDKTLAEPEQAGVYHSLKGGRVPLADWRSWVFCHAADRSSAILAYKAAPLVLNVKLGAVAFPFLVDFRVKTRSGFHFVAFDMPGVEPGQHDLLLSLAARDCPRRLVRITDQDFDTYMDTGTMLAPPDRRKGGAPPGNSRHSSSSPRP